MGQAAEKVVTSMSLVVTRSEGVEVATSGVGVEQYGEDFFMVILDEGEVWSDRSGSAKTGARGPVFDTLRDAASTAASVGQMRCRDELEARRRAQAEPVSADVDEFGDPS